MKPFNEQLSALKKICVGENDIGMLVQVRNLVSHNASIKWF